MPTENELVVKSNRLIEASYRLTMVEQQLILFAICQAREQQLGLSDSTYLPIRAQDFAKQFGMNPETVYRQLKEASGTLFERHVNLQDIHPETGELRENLVRWVDKVGYTKKAALVQIRFTKDVVPLITRLEKEFTSYRLSRVSSMTSIHGIRVYELLVQFIGIGERKFGLQELKEKLGVANEYKVINDFKKRVLDVAVSQINEHSDLKVAYSQTKTGRVVTGITFSIKSKTAGSAAPKRPKAPSQIALPLADTPPKSTTPEVLAERAKAKEALNNMKKKAGLGGGKGGRKSP